MRGGWFLYPKFWQTRNLISYLLLPCSLIYFVLSKLRLYCAKKIIFSAKVICVGNITVGGTGKTQVVIFLANYLKKQNIPFVILTKAYKSKLKSAVIVDNTHKAIDVGDEGVILRQYGAVIAAKNIGHAVSLIEQLKPKIILVDDGMQNPYLHKDYIILLIDGMRKFGNNFLIPAGPLREFQDQGIEKANAVIVVGEKNELNLKIQKLIFNAKIVPINNDLDLSKNYLAFCGIGNPDKFIKTLKEASVNLLDIIIFPDHHNYDNSDIKNLIKKAELFNASLITTEKDYVKIRDKLEVTYLKTEIIIEDSQQFLNIIFNFDI